MQHPNNIKPKIQINKSKSNISWKLQVLMIFIAVTIIAVPLKPFFNFNKLIQANYIKLINFIFKIDLI